MTLCWSSEKRHLEGDTTMIHSRSVVSQSNPARREHNSSSSITLVLADQHLLFRQALRHYLETEQGMRVLGETGDAFNLASLVELRRPDVVLVDAALPGLDVAETIRRIKMKCPSARVVVLSMVGDRDTFLSAVRAGADGFLIKDTPAEEVVSAIRQVAGGGSVISPALTGVLLREFRRLSSLQEGMPPVGLTLRELQLLRLVASGLSNKEIAQALCLAESTVKNRLSLLFEKLGVKDRTQAAIYALMHGLLPESEPGYPPGIAESSLPADQSTLDSVG
jgi:DNA-binding NarL/FixJ family response regulator